MTRYLPVGNPPSATTGKENVIYHHLSLFEHFSAVSNPFGSRLSLVIPRGEDLDLAIAVLDRS